MDTPRAPRVIGHGRVAACAGASFVVLTATWFTVLAAVPMLAGWVPFVITSQSMAPQIQRGSVVVASPVPDGLLVEPGTVITFRNDVGRIITHRVVRLDGTAYETKGDANRDPDSALVQHEDVLGSGRILIPFIGLPLVWAHEGRWLLVAATLVVVAACVHIMVSGLRGPSRADPTRRPVRRPRHLPRTTRVTGVALVLLLSGATSTSAAAFTSAGQSGPSTWQTARSWTPTFDAVTASDLPAHTASASQTLTFTLSWALAAGEEVTIDLTGAHRGSADYRKADQPTTSTGTAELLAGQGNSPHRTAAIVYTAPAGGLPDASTVSITIPGGILTTDPASYTIPFARSDNAAGGRSASFSVR